MIMTIDQFWNKFAHALLNQSMNYNQTHNFLCTSDQVIENIGNCKQFRLVSDFLFKSHVQFMVYLLVSGYPQVSGADQVISLITSNLRVPIR